MCRMIPRKKINFGTRRYLISQATTTLIHTTNIHTHTHGHHPLRLLRFSFLM